MKKQADKESFKKRLITVRFSYDEYLKVKKKSEAVGIKTAVYCREIALSGFILEKPNPLDVNEVRQLKQLLIEYRTNFSRIGNLISVSSPTLFSEITEVKNRLDNALKKYRL